MVGNIARSSWCSNGVPSNKWASPCSRVHPFCRRPSNHPLGMKMRAPVGHSFLTNLIKCNDSESKWTVSNDFLVQSLRSERCPMGKGPQTRGEPPVFISKRVVPKQRRNFCAATKKSTALYKLLDRLQEFFCRLSRSPGRPQD